MIERILIDFIFQSERLIELIEIRKEFIFPDRIKSNLTKKIRLVLLKLCSRAIPMSAAVIPGLVRAVQGETPGV